MNIVCRLMTDVVAVLIMVQPLKAQLKLSNYEIGINAGALLYQGDLSKSYLGDYKAVNPSIGISVSKTLDQYFSLRANLTTGKISADESKYQTPVWRQYRSFSFKTSVTELSTTLVFKLLGEGNGLNYRRLLPYVFAGAGLSLLKVKPNWSRVNTSVYDPKSSVMIGLGIDTVHTLPKVLPVIPMGLGLRYSITNQLSLGAEAAYRFTTSDYLDGFKYSGNDTKRDGYYGISIGISYKFGGYKCPESR